MGGSSVSTRWPGIYIVGLTGNIATGKTVVRKMLAELGAITIDADELAHEALYRQGPAYQAVVEAFGREIVRENGEIDRGKLGALVFRDPAQLARLESLVHPAVLALVDGRMQAVMRPDLPAEWLSAPRTWARKDGKPVVVLEAIKLFESGLAAETDQVWATSAPREHQLERLMRQRQMSAAEAHARIEAQAPQLEKLARADVVLDDAGTLNELRAQVVKAWQKLMQGDSIRA